MVKRARDTGSEHAEEYERELFAQLRMKRLCLAVDANVTAAAYVTKHASAFSHQAYWAATVTRGDIPRVSADLETLPQADPVLVSLRWLGLRISARGIDITCQMRNRLARKAANRLEDEVQYHAIMLTVLRESARGQDAIMFEEEDRTKRNGDANLVQHAVREDIRCFIKGRVCHPVEGKHNVCPGSDDIYAIDANRIPLGKLLKVCHCSQYLTVCPTRQCCIFFVNIWAVHLVYFSFDDAGQLIDTKVIPPFPTNKVFHEDSVLFDATSALTNFTPTANVRLIRGMRWSERGFQAPRGFHLLCRHVAGLEILHALDPCVVSFQRLDGSFLERRNSRVVYEGPQSLIVECESCTIKVAPSAAIDVELTAHRILDGHAHIRRCLGVLTIQPSFDPLRAIQLEGPGIPLTFDMVHANFAAFFHSALSALQHIHSNGCVHRDVKLANMVLIGERLVLTDFETVSRLPVTIDREVGTPIYSSCCNPTSFAPIHDIYSLVVSFAEPYVPSFQDIPFSGRSAVISALPLGDDFSRCVQDCQSRGLL